MDNADLSAQFKERSSAPEHYNESQAEPFSANLTGAALVISDLQRYYCEPNFSYGDGVDGYYGSLANEETQQVARAMAAFVEEARRKNIPVIWIYHKDVEKNPNHPEFYEIHPLPGEKVFGKTSNCPYETTELASYAKGEGICTFIAGGVNLRVCVRALAIGGQARGFDTWLVSDLTGDGESIKAADWETQKRDLEGDTDFYSMCSAAATINGLKKAGVHITNRKFMEQAMSPMSVKPEFEKPAQLYT